MNKTIYLFIVLTVCILDSFGQKGKTFPTLDGEVITKEEITFPDDVKGKVTLIGMAYSKKSDELLKEWFNPVYTTFVEPPSVGFLPPDPYDINIYFIGLLKGIAKAASGKVEAKMTKNLDPKLHKHTVISQGNLKDYKKVLGLGRKDFPYFFILDQNGKIIHHTEGAYTESKMSQIKDLVDDLAY